MDNNKLLLVGAGVGAAALASCAVLRSNRVEYIEDDDAEEALIPSGDALEALRYVGRSPEDVAREKAFASLPVGRVRPTAVPVPGSIVREKHTFVPRIHRLKVRAAAEFLPTDELTGPAEMWADPQPHEYENTNRDGRRWEWAQHTRLDEGQQLVSSQYEFVSEEYGVRVLLMPTLRLADKQFYDSIAEELIDRKAFILLEAMHHKMQEDHLRMQESKCKELAPRPYGDLPLAQTKPLAHRAGSDGVSILRSFGNDCTTLDYLTTLIQSHCAWHLGDPALGDEHMKNISASVNHIKSFRPLCEVREAYLMSKIDDCLRAAGSTEAWKQFTGETVEGEKLVALPWNGRHGTRIEKFLLQHRGFKPVPEAQVHRIIFDRHQVNIMVLKAREEDVRDKNAAEQLIETPGPAVVPSFAQPPHNFGAKVIDTKAAVCLLRVYSSTFFPSRDAHTHTHRTACAASASCPPWTVSARTSLSLSTPAWR